MKLINCHKHFLFAVCLSFLTYVIFYGQFLAPSNYFWSNDGQQTDAQTKHVPARTYLYDEIVHQHSFPFWTEKMYSGFPIYADMENAYLHPVNVASILVFGPQLSYKVLHLLEYLIGSLSFYFLLKRKGIGLLGYAAANAIFYFNTFSIDHQIHFNMIMALYLIPTALLLADLFLEKRQLRYIILESLVIANAVLWGHMQSAVIIFMGIFAYMAVFSFKKMRFATFLFYFIALTLFVTIETLPQILPTYELFSQSSRSSNLDYLKGSLNPRMAIFSFVPYLLGGYQDFMGSKINDDITYNEMYTYFGISSMILSFLALLLLKKSRDIVLAFIFIWIFLIFGFMTYNKIFPDGTPLVSLFRDWGRTAALSSFGVALLVGIFVEKINEASYKNIRTGILFVLAPLVYIWMLAAMDSGKIARRITPYVSPKYIQAYPYFHILAAIVLALAGILLLFFIAKKWYPRIYPKTLLPVKILLIVVVFFDLIYFSGDVLAFRLQDISGYKPAAVPKELENKRAILSDTAVLGMESLYYKNWSPFGSSQLKEKDYVDYYDRLGVDLRGVSSSDVSALLGNYQKLKGAGIVAVDDINGITYLNNSELDLIKNNVEGHYVKKEEGHIIMQINNPSDTTINTYLRYDPNWKVMIDGRKTKISEDGIFFDFLLDKGAHLVEVYYCPQPFFQGIFLSALLFVIALSLYVLRGKLLPRLMICREKFLKFFS
jgi:hypothetical protein